MRIGLTLACQMYPPANHIRPFHSMRPRPPYHSSWRVLLPSNRSADPSDHGYRGVWKLLIWFLQDLTRTDLFDFRQTSLSDADQRERLGVRVVTSDQSQAVIRHGMPGGRTLEKGGTVT